MNTFANLLPSVGGNRPPLSDEELRRLAEMLQQRGEGLAAINPQEAQMLKDAGGSGKPLPGTKGLGVGGGPIRSYDPQGAPNNTGTGANVSSGSVNTVTNNDNNNGGNGGGGGGPIGPEPGGPDSSQPETSEQQTASEQASIEGQAKAHNENTIKFEDDPRVIQAYNNLNQNQGGGNGGSQQQQQQQQQKPKFYDSLGGVHDTQEAADAANLKIVEQQVALEDKLKAELTSDMDFDTFSQRFFKNVKKESVGESTQVKGEPRQETFEEWKTRTNKSYENYSTDPNITGTRPETYNEFMERINFPVFNLNSYNESKKAYEDALKGEGNYEVKQIRVDPPLSESEYNDFLQKEYNTLSANNTLQMVDTFTTKVGPSTFSIVREADGFELLPESEVERIFNIAMQTVQKETTLQTEQFRGNVIDLFNDGTFTARGKRVKNQQGEIVDVVPTTFAEADAKLSELYPDSFGRLSESQKRAVLQDALEEFARIEAFTLTIEDVERFTRPAPKMNAGLSFQEWWSSKGGPAGDFKTKDAARKAYEQDTTIIQDITATDIANVGDAIAPTITTGIISFDDWFASKGGSFDADGEIVGPYTSLEKAREAYRSETGNFDITGTTLDEVLDVASNAGELKDVILEEDELIKVLKSRVAGTEPSVAEIQLKRGTEQNLKALLATTAGVMDPTKLRQTRNMWMDIQQIFTGQKAELRAAEQVQAEQNLLAVLKAKGTREASIQIANMEKDIQMSIAQGNLDQARKIQNQQAALTLVTVQAEIDKDVRLANLDKERIIAIEQGKLDLATKIANLEKEILIAKVNAQLALDSRKLDDALAIAAYQGEQALAGVEVEIDLAQLRADLVTAEFEVRKDLALMDRETQLAVARLVGELKTEQAKADRDQNKINGIISAIATVGATYLRFKTGV